MVSDTRVHARGGARTCVKLLTWTLSINANKQKPLGIHGGSAADCLRDCRGLRNILRRDEWLLKNLDCTVDCTISLLPKSEISSL